MNKEQQYRLAGTCAFIFTFSAFVGTFGGMSFDLGAQYRSQDYYRRAVEDIDGEALFNQVRSYHATTRIQRRRDYADARDKCRDLNAAGVDVECPDINDYDAILDFLKKDFFESDTPEEESDSSDEDLHGAAPEPELTYDELDSTFRTLLRQYLRRQTCPEGMKKFLSGFHALCQRMIDEGYQRPRRAAQDRAARERVRAILETDRVP